MWKRKGEGGRPEWVEVSAAGRVRACCRVNQCRRMRSRSWRPCDAQVLRNKNGLLKGTNQDLSSRVKELEAQVRTLLTGRLDLGCGCGRSQQEQRGGLHQPPLAASVSPNCLPLSPCTWSCGCRWCGSETRRWLSESCRRNSRCVARHAPLWRGHAYGHTGCGLVLMGRQHPGGLRIVRG